MNQFVRDLSGAARRTMTLGGRGWHWVVHVWSGPHSQTLLGCWRERTFCCVAENSEQAHAKTLLLVILL